MRTRKLDIPGHRYSVVETEAWHSGYDVTVEEGWFIAHHLFRHVLTARFVDHVDVTNWGKCSFMFSRKPKFSTLIFLTENGEFPVEMGATIDATIFHFPDGIEASESEQGLWHDKREDKLHALGSGRCPPEWDRELQWKRFFSTGSPWEDPVASYLSDSSPPS